MQQKSKTANQKSVQRAEKAMKQAMVKKWEKKEKKSSEEISFRIILPFNDLATCLLTFRFFQYLLNFNIVIDGLTHITTHQTLKTRVSSSAPARFFFL